MSDVKMCDNCGNVFSVNESGWEEFTRTRAQGDDRGVFNNPNNHGAITQHIGPCCKLGQGNVVRPRIAMQELESGAIDTGYDREKLRRTAEYGKTRGTEFHD